MDSWEPDHNTKKDPKAIPYHQNLELEQVFHSCHVYITLLRQSPAADKIVSHIDAFDETLQWTSTQFTSNQNISASCSLLLILILQEVYEVLRRYFDPESSVVEQESASPIKVVPPGQVLVSFEKLAKHLDVPLNDRENIENYMFRLQSEVHQATEATASLKKTVVTEEIWCNQLAALALYCYPRYLDSVKDSTKMALQELRRLFETAGITE